MNKPKPIKAERLDLNGIPLVTGKVYPKPRLGKIILKEGIITAKRPIRAKKYTPEINGQRNAEKLLGYWNSQKNPKKGYFLNRRIHHGLLGAILWGIGTYYNEPYLKEFGKTLTLDDIHDAPNWFDFEKGGVDGELLSFV